MNFSKKMIASVIFAVFVGALFSVPVRAETSATEWVGQNPTFIKSRDISAEQYQSYESNNVPCTPTLVRKKGAYSNGWNSWIGDAWAQGCLVPMTSAYADMGSTEILYYGSKLNYLLGDGEKSFGMGRFYMMFPVANTSKIAFVGYDNRSLVITKDYTQTFGRAERDSYTNIFLMRTKDYDFTLKDDLGQSASVNSGTISYSKNGLWMTVSALDKAWLRINLDTDEILPFASPKPRGGYGTSQTISSDGRFVAVFNPYDGLYVYDLEKCEVAKGALVSRNCQFMKMGIPELSTTLGGDLVFISRLIFEGDGKLSASVNRRLDGQFYYEEYKISVPTQVQPVKYLALGDSFSSGEGAYDYQSYSDFYIDENNYNLCHQSRSSYPYLLNETLQADWFGSVACSGAVGEDVVYISSEIIKDYMDTGSQAKSLIKSQQFVDQAVSTPYPGYIPQGVMVDENHPSVATISIGGNDVGFGDIITACITQAGCYSARDDREELADLITSKVMSLTSKYKTILNGMSGDNPRLYVIGYPKITSSNNALCSLIGQSEREFADALVDYLNETIKIAASNAGARYIDASNALIDYESGEDHRLCGNSSKAVNGLVLFNSDNLSARKPGQLYHSESYHPNRSGQLLMTKTILTMTNNMKLGMPEMAAYKVKPHDSFYTNLVGDNEDHITNKDSYYGQLLKESVMSKDSSAIIRFDTNSNQPQAISEKARIELHSEPIVLGEVPINKQGVTEATVKIPSDVAPGYHQLHVIYTDFSGKEVDRFQYVYVLGSETDYDGDGVPNDQEICAIGGSLGVDEDEDGVDDACDPEIVKESPVYTDEAQPPATEDASAETVAGATRTSTPGATTQNVEHEAWSADSGALAFLPAENAQNATGIFSKIASMSNKGTSSFADVSNNDAQKDPGLNVTSWFFAVAAVVGLVVSVGAVVSRRKK